MPLKFLNSKLKSRSTKQLFQQRDEFKDKSIYAYSKSELNIHLSNMQIYV